MQAFLLQQFTRVLRSKTRGPVMLAWRRFWDGLPVPGLADPVYAHPAYFATQAEAEALRGGGAGDSAALAVAAGGVFGARALGADTGAL